MHIAMSWAQCNYRKKLNNSTLDIFNKDINDLLQECSANQVKTTTTTDGQQSVNKTPVPVINVNPSLSPAAPIIQPPLPQRVTRRRRRSVQSTSGTCSPPPSPASLAARPSYASVLSVEPVTKPKHSSTVTPARATLDNCQFPRRLAFSSPPKVSKPNVITVKQVNKEPVWVAPRTHHKDKEWRLPIISTSVRTLVIGTSNIGRITKLVDTSTALLSFPGAKFKHFVELFKKTKSESIYPQVDKVIFSCGINDRSNKVTTTTFPSYKKACNSARELFPNAQVFFVLPNWDITLPNWEQHNLEQLKKMIATDKSGVVHLIPAIPPSKFVVTHDKIHWTQETANRMLEHWLGFVNTPSKN